MNLTPSCDLLLDSCCSSASYCVLAADVAVTVLLHKFCSSPASGSRVHRIPWYRIYIDRPRNGNRRSRNDGGKPNFYLHRCSRRRVAVWSPYTPPESRLAVSCFTSEVVKLPLGDFEMLADEDDDDDDDYPEPRPESIHRNRTFPFSAIYIPSAQRQRGVTERALSC